MNNFTRQPFFGPGSLCRAVSQTDGEKTMSTYHPNLRRPINDPGAIAGQMSNYYTL